MADFNADLIAGGATDMAGSQLDLTHGDVNADVIAEDATDMAGFQLDFAHGDFDTDLIAIGGGDPNPPTIENVSPANMADIDRHTPVTFDAIDLSPGIGLMVIWMRYLGDVDWTLVYDGDEFTGIFERESFIVDNSVSGSSDLAFSILPAGGWRRGFSMRIRIVDGDGNIDVEL